MAVFRRRIGSWYLANSGGGTASVTWGTTGDVPRQPGAGGKAALLPMTG